MTELTSNHKEFLSNMVETLNGDISYYTTLDHSGKQSKKIVIEYDVKRKGVPSEE